MVCNSKTFNVGDKVRVVDAPTYNGSKRFIGKQLVVSKVVGDVEGGNVHFEGFGDCVLGVDLELVESKLTKKRRIEALEKDVARQETELEELRAKIEAFEQKAKSAVWLSDAMRKATKETSDTISKALLEVTPNQRRARIIADAKGFVEQTIEDARDEYGDIVVPDPLEIGNPWCCREIKFEVNAEKRSVVALAIGICVGKVVEKAIAKCAPDDVFNADIGKAIAVGRLFDLDVERFVNAPKPTEVVVGHLALVQGFSSAYASKVVERYTEVCGDTNTVGWLRNNPQDLLAILDDTEAQYE